MPETKRPMLNSKLQQNFDRIYIDSEVTNETVVTEIAQIIQTI